MEQRGIFIEGSGFLYIGFQTDLESIKERKKILRKIIFQCLENIKENQNFSNFYIFLNFLVLIYNKEKQIK